MLIAAYPSTEESNPVANSSSCHVFMTESPVPGANEALQTAKEFQFEPERTEDGLNFKVIYQVINKDN